MQDTQASTSPNANIQQMTNWIIWGSILLCAFLNLVLIVHVVTFVAGWITLPSLIGFLALTGQFHAGCLVLCVAALAMNFLFAHFDRETA